MITELFHNTGKRTKFTGAETVRNGIVATAIGTNIDRVSRFLTAPGTSGQPAASTG